MREIKNSKIKYFLPPILIDLFRLIKAYHINKAPTALISANVAWHDKFRGEKVLIIGNGPSVNRVNLTLIAGQKVIVMNSFEHAKWKNSVNIVAHCIGEPSMVSAWSYPEILKNIQGTNAESYWLHFTSYGFFEECNKKEYLQYVLTLYEPGLWGKRPINLAKPALNYQTTAQLAIEVALYMGFKEIGLLGFDHDWLASPEYSKHFYSGEKDSHDMLDQMSYLEIVNMIERMWRIYYKVRDIAQHNGTEICNLTEHSYLDVFKKRNLEDFLK